MVRISVIIPVKNGEKTIKDCLNAIFNQTLISQTEVIIIDSGSTDSTLEIARKFQVRIFEIKVEDFNHGRTRNYGISLAKGELVAFTVQDAEAINNMWLENMASHFKDNEVAGVCGQQVVLHRPGINPLQWFRPISEPGISNQQYKNRKDFSKLSPKQKRFVCGWDDVSAMYRKNIMQVIPFEPVIFQEDCLWAKMALLNGHKIIFDKRARVHHYHHTTYNQQFNRKKIEFLCDYAMFEKKPEIENLFNSLLLILTRSIKFKVSPKWIVYNTVHLFANRKAQKFFLKNYANISPDQAMQLLYSTTSN